MSIGELLKTKGAKNVMNKIYSWGASIVLIGALFKLEHWQYSSLLLMVGLITEAVIFVISGFEPPMEMPDWAKVYPELKEDFDGDDITKPIARATGAAPAGNVEQVLADNGLSKESLEKLSKSLGALNGTAENLVDLSKVAGATEGLVGNINTASDSLDSFSKANSSAGEAINSNITKIKDSGNQLSDAYQKVADALANDISNLDKNSKDFSSNVAKINQSLASLNSMYELQMKGSEEFTKSKQAYSKGIAEMSKSMDQSMNETAKLKDQTVALQNNLKALNDIYGNMLGAMNFKK